MIETIYLQTNNQVFHAVKIQVPDDGDIPQEDKEKAALVVLMRSLIPVNKQKAA